MNLIPCRTYRVRILSCVRLFLSITILLFALPVYAQKKTVARSAKDLPVHAYPAKDSLAVIVKDDTRLDVLGAEVKSAILADLAAYDIADSALLKSFYFDLADISFYQHDYAAALKYYDLVKSLETKPAAIATSGLVKRSQMMAGDPASDGYLTRFRAALVSNLGLIPYTTAESSLQRIRGQYKNIDAAGMIQMASRDLDPALAKGSLTREDAGYLLFLHYEMPLFDRLAPVISSVMDSLVAANATKVVNVWPARSVTLEAGKPYKPVVVCVFDLGTDVSLFKDRIYTNPKERMDGIDNDKNGFVDDVHGVAFDVNENKVTPLLKPWPAAQEKLLPVRLKLMKGFADERAGVNSTEAALFRDSIKMADAKGKSDLIASMGEMNAYAHGTHVAGITLDGNPYARMMVVRMSSDNGSINEGKGASEESERKVAANLKELVAYWKKANVRVVTMSWGFFVSDYEGDIKAFHPELSEAEVKARALKLWTMRKDALYKAFSLAPEILFIASNGNKNSDSDNDFRYPAALDLPNMIGVGSVDASGQQTSFTATGSKVKVHANGFQVESFAPGGSKFLMSGTSMATPYIANLAVKLLVVKPTLTALQVRDLIIKGADVSADGKVILANPKKSFELLAAMK